MNCFQKLLSSWWRTTTPSISICMEWLWIAFKNYYLRDEGQLISNVLEHWVSCELLSKIIIFVMKDNQIDNIKADTAVVNCFQKLLSSWWRTTPLTIGAVFSSLWIAFKNYYLRDEGQRKEIKLNSLSGCELLSKIIIFVMKDNMRISNGK